MENNKDSKGSGIMWIAIIIIAILAIMIIAGIGEGLYYFISDGGGKWLLVVGGLIVFALLVAHAKGE